MKAKHLFALERVTVSQTFLFRDVIHQQWYSTQSVPGEAGVGVQGESVLVTAAECWKWGEKRELTLKEAQRKRRLKKKNYSPHPFLCESIERD